MMPNIEIEWEPYVHPSERDDLFLIGGAGVYRIGHYGRERFYHTYLRRGIKP